MAQNGAANALAAFEMLLEEMQAEIDATNKAGSAAFAAHDYEQVHKTVERAQAMSAIRTQLAALRKEWQALGGTPTHREAVPEADGRQRSARLRPGLRTREDAYYRPILQVLTEMGGSGVVDKVLARVEQLMKGVLRPVDYEPIPSDPNVLRWRNGAQWARRTLVKRGYLKANSPIGLWEISDVGRAFLAQARS